MSVEKTFVDFCTSLVMETMMTQGLEKYRRELQSHLADAAENVIKGNNQLAAAYFIAAGSVCGDMARFVKKKRPLV